MQEIVVLAHTFYAQRGMLFWRFVGKYEFNFLIDFGQVDPNFCSQPLSCLELIFVLSHELGQRFRWQFQVAKFWALAELLNPLLDELPFVPSYPFSMITNVQLNGLKISNITSSTSPRVQDHP
jgi:hypothetical protein